MSPPPLPPQQGWGQPPPWQPPPRKPRLPLVLGVLIGAVAPFLGFVPPIAFPDAPDVFQLSPVIMLLGVLLAGVVLLFPEGTRRWGLGILIGLFGMLIIGAGACVAVLVVVLSAYNGG